MITKTLAFVIALTFNSLNTENRIVNSVVPVEIDFCHFNTGFGESICTIEESNFDSRNKIVFDQNGENPKLIIDKRTVTSDKAKYIYNSGTLSIGQANSINLPFKGFRIDIQPGEYQIVEKRNGYEITLD